MKSSTLPGLMQKNLISADTNQLMNEFASTISGIKYPKATRLKWYRWYLLSFIMLLILMQVEAWGQTAGPNYPGTGTNVNGPGTVAWSNSGNITADDVSYATANLGNNATSEYIQGTNYGFSIPTDATINGIQVTIMRQSSANTGGASINDVDLNLLKAGAIVGSDKAVTTDWPTSMQTATYGNASDLWGTTWTPAEINNTNFGVSLSVLNQSGFSSRTASVDYIQITVTYTAPAAEPTTQTSNVTFSSISATGMTINWTSGDGTNRIVLVKSGSAVDSDPVDGTTYTPNTVFGSGQQIGTGNSVVYTGTGNSVAITGLSANTTYYVAVYEFNGTGGGQNYLTVSPATGSQLTAPAAPVATAGTNVTGTSFDANWNITTGATGYRLDVATNNTFTNFVTGYTDLDVSNVLTYPVTGLTPGIPYYYRVRAYNTGGTGVNSNTITVATSIGEPTLQATAVAFSLVTANSMTIGWSRGDGSDCIVLVNAGSPVSTDPLDGSTYTASTVFGNGSLIGTSRVVYIGTGTSVDITALASNTTYHVAVYEFNGTGGAENYLTLSPAIGSQATVDPASLQYRSIGNGNWGTGSTWEVSSDGGGIWVTASSGPTSANDIITVRNGNTVLVNASVTVDQVVIETGGQVTINTGNTLTINDGSGTDLSVSGTLLTNSTSNNAGFINNGQIVFNDGGTYQHNVDGETVPTATWAAGSNCNITGMTTTYPGGMGQNFGNVAFNLNTTSTIEMASSLTCQGNLSLANSNTGSLRLTNGNTSRTISVGGNLIHTTGEFRHNNGLGTGNITVQGDFIKSGSGTYTIVSGSANSSLTVAGNVLISAGTLTMSEDVSIGTINVGGNFSHTGGTITESNTGSGAIIFNGGGAMQTFTSGGTVSNTINYTVNNGSFLQMANGSTVVNGNAFTLAAGAKLGVTSPDGITTAGTAAGNIRTTTRTYTTGANYEYNGSAAQVTGNGLSANTPANVTIKNAAGVALSANTTISGLLDINTGTLNLANSNITTESLAGSGDITNNGTGTATITVNGNGNSTYDGAILNGATSSEMAALTKSGSGSLTLTNSTFTYTGPTTITSGSLILNPGSSTATFASSMVLNGGTLSTAGISSGRTITSSSTLDLNSNSNILLGNTDHSIIFAPSDGITWAGLTLAINGWTGAYSTSGTNGKLFFGSPTGLNDNKLAKISFTGFPGTTMLLGTGELVPVEITGPVLAITGTFDHGNTCVSSSATPITYTITNIGSAASGISVTSDNTQFVVSNLSSTTIPAFGGTATFQVTFTPDDAGSRSAIITVTSTTPDSNTPSISLTGTGVASPTASAGGSQTICQNGTATVSGALASNGTILWTENGAGSITAGANTEAPTYTAAAGDAGNTITLTMTVSNAYCAPATATYTVHVDGFATANAGPSQSTCAGGTITLAGSIGGSATSSLWTASTGSFSNATSLTSTYTPSITSGTVVLTLTATNLACPPASNTMTVTVNPLPSATGATICQGATGQLTSSTVCAGGGTSAVGPQNAGTGTNVNGPGSDAWSNTSYITADDNNFATATVSNTNPRTSEYLQATNFGFSIPTGATINGIQVQIMRMSSSNAGGNSLNDADLYLMKAGSITGSDKATGTDWPTSMGSASYGSTSDLWGASWTAEDINNPNFGVSLSAFNQSTGGTRTASVDYIQVTVTYTITITLDWYTLPSGGTKIGSGSPFNPVGAPGSTLANTDTPGTYTFYAACSENPDCRAAADFVIQTMPSTPTINHLGPLAICTNAGGSVILESSSATGNQWYRDASILTGETGQQLLVTIPGSYTVIVTSGVCTTPASAPALVTSNVPAIATDAAASSTCYNLTIPQTSSLAYSSTNNLPTTYSIVWNGTPTNSFVDVTNASLPLNAIPVTVPAGTASGTYSGNLTVRNADGCVSEPVPFNITVYPYPVADFHYADPYYCSNNATNPSPILGPGASAGTFSASPAGMTINPATGQITLATTTPNTYTVYNTVTSNGCTTVGSASVIIQVQPTVTISYGGTPYCNTISTPQNVTRNLTGSTTFAGGHYEASPAGLTINSDNDNLGANAAAGQIIPSTSQPGIYTVTYIFDNGLCSNTQTTTVEITTAPVITGQPVAPAPVCKNNGIATISVTATGAGLNYQWRRNSVPLSNNTIYSGVNTATLTITNPTLAEDATTYDVVITGLCAPPATSSAVALSVIDLPEIQTNPELQSSMCSGTGSATISVVATGHGLTYQWYKNFAVLEESSVYHNVTSSTLTIENPTLSENGAVFYVVVTGTCGEVTSGSTESLVVYPSPIIFNVSGTTTVCNGTATEIGLDGSQPGVRYQLVNTADNSPIGSPVDGISGPITLSAGILTVTTNVGVMATEQTHSCSILMNGTAIITVIPVITNNTVTSAATVCSGSVPSLVAGSIPQGGDGNYFYFWESSTNGTAFIPADGVNDNQSYAPGLLTSDTWFRRTVISGPCSNTSSAFKITINPLPAATLVTGPLGGVFCASTILEASNGGDGVIYYQGTTPNNTDVRFPQTSATVYASGTYYFRAFRASTGCWGPDGSVSVILTLPPATVGTEICQGESGALVAAAPCPSPSANIPSYSGSAADNAGTGTVAWSNPGNITTTGSPYATASSLPDGGITHYLMATNYGFDIPADATISGVTVTVRRSSTGNASPYIRDNVVRLIRGGAIGGNNKAKASTDWPTSMGTSVYGSNSDTWGFTGLVPADFNASNFGVALSAVNNAVSTYPVIAGTATSASESPTTTHTVTLPSNIQAGDLLLIFWADASSSTNLTTPGGWTNIYSSSGGGSGYRRAAYYRFANGSEGSSVQFTTSGPERSAHNSYRIASGTYQGTPSEGNINFGTSTNPDPPNLTSGFGSTYTLWLAASHSSSSSALTAPASYSDLVEVNTGAGSPTASDNATMGTARRLTQASSENPGTFTLSQSASWGANTVAIQGISGIKSANVDYVQVTVSYVVNGVLNWYTSASGGTPIGTGSPFNPIGVPGSGMPDSNSPGTYTFWSECSSVPGCRTANSFVINPLPEAPVAGSNLYTYDNLEKTAEAIVDPGETLEWYENATGGAPIDAPSATNAGSYSAYAQARNSYGCASLTRTLVTLTIEKRPVTITANAGQTKVYGDTDPLAFAYTVTGDGLATGDSFTGALQRDPGEDVGSYPINIGTLEITNQLVNYDVTYVPGSFSITVLPVTVTADAGQTKVYGSTDPLPFTYTSIPTGLLANGETVNFTGALSRVAGEDAGLYAITQGNLANTNYDITFVPANFTITGLPVTVTADGGQTKVYGAVDPLPFTYTSVPAVGSTLSNGEILAFTGALSRVTGENVGLHAITQGNLANANYDITFVPADFTITAMPITVTANAGQTKVYGAADPLAFTYTTVPTGILPNGETVSFTGALSRVAGENVGLHAITQGNLANANYDITFVPADFTITAMPITVTADAGQTKVYGAADPLVYTYTSVPTGLLPNGETVSFTGALSRVAGEDVGVHAITQGNLANANYDITFVPANFTITALSIIVTADAGQGKVYGSADPLPFTYASVPAIGSTLTNGEIVAFTGALSRVTGENVGLHAITQGNLANPNYDITFVPADFTITAMPVTVTANAGQTKVYGAADPLPFTYTSVPAVGSTLTNGDIVAFTGALSRVAGENVGLHALTQGNLANANYDITFVPADFTITSMPITVTADAGQTKVYGAADPLAYTYTSVPTGLLPNGETVSFTGALSRVAGEDVGLHAITQGNLANANYNITFVPANFTITAMPITVTADAGQTKVYGAADPLAYTYTSVPTGLLPNGETVSFTGALSRVAGEDVGLHAITQGDLANANYDITFVPANFTITGMPITVTANAGQTKVYGAVDPLPFTYTSVPAVGSTLVNGDIVAFTGALSRIAGENVGLHAITQGNLANANYDITFVPADFTITAMPITVTANAGQTKVYGAADPLVYTYTSVPTGLLPNGETVSFTGALSRVAGEDVGLHAITQGNLANANYDITFVPADFTITAMPITVTADAGQTKVYGAADPLVYTYTSVPTGLLPNGETVSFTGALSRVAGEDVGLHAITQGNLANANYDITFVPANFTITAMPITVTADAGQTKVYGAADPLAYTYTSVPTGLLPNGETVSFTGALSRVAGEDVGLHAITQGNLANANYDITFVPANFTITAMPITVTAIAGQTKVYGAVDPLPFTYTSVPAIGSTLTNGDIVAFTGALSRVTGENVGLHAITQGNLANANYDITFVPADFTITAMPITVTANAGQTKVYGAADPLVYTYTTVPTGILPNGETVSFTGALSRVAGENVGLHAITQGNLANANYDITFVPADFTITAMPITVTADAGQTKVYGAADPLVYTYTSVPTGLLPNGETVSFTGALSRVAGEDVGVHAITQGNLANANYDITFVPANFTITAMPITVTANAGQTKVYGAADPLPFTYTSVPAVGSTLANGDIVSFTGALSRAAGENVGLHAITQGNLANANYDITFVPANFTITAMPITVTANAGQTKVYGAVDPLPFTYTSVPAVGSTLTNGDIVSFTGALSRIAGENVGLHAITQGNLANANYDITFVPADFTITAMPITVTANAGQTKVYGAADPLVYTYTSVPTGLLPNGETVSFTGALSRVAGEDVGLHAITQGNLANANYDITFVPANFTITAMPITVTADAGQTKVYGAADPLAYTYTSLPAVGSTLANGDIVAFTGALSRVAGENVGVHAITQGNLANANYDITFVPADFTITAMPVTVTANAGQTKVYGAINPAFYTFTSSPAVGSTLANGDLVSFTGALTRIAGENVGSYAIQQGTLANSNYNITFVPATFTITGLPIIVTANAGQSKVYGSVDPLVFTYTSAPTGTLPNGDVVSFTGSLTRIAGENAGSYAIQQGTLANSNYAITFVPANFTITPMPISVTAISGQTKVYGAVDPAYTYTSAPTGLLPNGATVSFTGALSRVAGENVGSYAIQQGTLANSNYTITFIPANFTITAMPVTVTVNPGQTKAYGTADPVAYTYTSNPTGLLPNGATVSFTGALSRVAGENVGSYAIQQGTLANSNYTINFVSNNFTITAMTITVTATAGQTKVYGTADPAAYTYTSAPAVGTVLPNGGTVSFTGALTRATGENVGPHAIQQGTLANSNYNITFVSSNFVITARPVTVTANAQNKVYGNADPVLTYQLTTGTLVGTDAFSGVLTRVAGENIGTYAIQQGTLTLGANYTITYVGANLTITSRPITITADPKTKVYGTVDPALTYQITSGSLAGNGDAFSGALTRDPGQNIGTYAIRQGTLALNSNYTLTYVGANLTITTRAITVTANAQTKVYGAIDPALTYTITSGTLSGTDAFTGALTRDAGENIGTYPIRQGTLALNNNYALTYVGANLTVTTRAVTVTADAQTKVYGTVDPVLTYRITSGTLAGNGDAFSGSLTRAAGENVGNYAITQGTLSLGPNYNLTYIGADLTITNRSVTVTADDATKVYGDPDNLTYQITSGTLAGTDSFSGSLSHTGGEDVGTYPITLGTLALNSNYTLNFIGATLTIVERPVTVTANTLSKVYGDSDPQLTYSLSTGSLASGDSFTGGLVRVPGEDVGTYAISQGTLALNSNYILTFTGATFTITQRLITVTADAKIKIYGDPDPEFTYQITSGNLAGNGDAFTGSLTRDAGEDVGNYAITQGTLALSSNYTLTYIGADLTISKSEVAITVAADPKSKVYGESDPELTYQIVSGTLIGTDTFTGELTREPGENVGTYAINQGTLALNDNYELVFTSADFTITARPITVTADDKSKVFGENDPELTYEITSGELAGNGDAFTGALTRAPGEDVGIYVIQQGTLSLGINYEISFEEAELEITKGFEMNAYPNPFTDHLTLEFDLNNDSEVILEIYNVVGVKIATVFSGNLTADHYLFNYEPDHISDGMIIYKLIINGHEMFVGKAIKKR